MKVFQNKNLFKKLILILVLITIVSFCIPKGVSAADDGIGGKLLNPIMSLFVSIGDGTMTLLQKVALGIDESLIQVNTDSSLWAKIIVIAAALVICSIIAFATFASVGAAGWGIIAIADILKGFTLGAITIGLTIITFPVSTTVLEGMLPKNFQLPIFEITPQEIFSNKIPLFDVDFFNPQETSITRMEKATGVKKKSIDLKLETLQQKYGLKSLEDAYWGMKYADSEKNDYIVTSKIDEIKGLYGEDKISNLGTYGRADLYYYYVVYHWNNGDFTYMLINEYSKIGNAGETWTGFKFKSADVSEGTILTKCVRDRDTDTMDKYILNIDDVFPDGLTISATDETNEILTVPAGTIESTAKELRATISSWYVILRNIAIVALLSILVYVGIRILISSTSPDKAKYKQMLIDWVVAICLLFLMQYIMSFSNMLVEKVIELIDSTQVSISNGEKVETVRPGVYVIADSEKVKKAYDVLIDPDTETQYNNYFINSAGEKATSKEEAVALVWPAENFMQQARLELQLLEDGANTYVSIGWKLIYVVLVIYTIIFAFAYIKRVIYMAFLTIIAPLVAMTYPLDKMNDGKAQAFDMWLKEYIFNLLIQPMHLILYTILIGSAMTFASQNIIYVIVALGFMVPAEKILRKFFGFEKAQTPGMLGGAAGAALMWNGVNRLMGHKPPKGPPGSKSEGKAESSSSEKAPRFKTDFDKDEAILNSGVREEQDLVTDDSVSSEATETGSNQKMSELSEATTIASQQKTTQNVQKKDGITNTASTQDAQPKIQTASNSSMTKGKIDNSDNLLGNDVKKPKIKRYYGKGFKTGAKYYANGMKEKMVNSFNNAHPLKAAAKIGAGTLGAATFATAGGILGIASGDPSKGFQYAATGTMGGYNFGRGVSTGIENTFGVEGTFDEADRGTYESESDYRQAQIDKYVEKLKKDKDFKEKFAREIDGNKKDVEKIMESNFVDNLATKGITDQNDIIAAYELKNEKNLSDNETAALVKYSKLAGDISKMHSSDAQKWSDTFEGKLKKKGASDKIAKQKTKDIMEANKIYFKYRNDL